MSERRLCLFGADSHLLLLIGDLQVGRLGASMKSVPITGRVAAADMESGRCACEVFAKDRVEIIKVSRIEWGEKSKKGACLRTFGYWFRYGASFTVNRVCEHESSRDDKD